MKNSPKLSDVTYGCSLVNCLVILGPFVAKPVTVHRVVATVVGRGAVVRSPAVIMHSHVYVRFHSCTLASM